MTDLLPSVLLETAENPDAAIIWLHGLGSDGHDFESIVPALGVQPDQKWRFVFPHAPQRPVTVNGGMMMRAWYDIYEMTLERKVDMANIEESCQQIEALVQAQIASGIDASRIVLAGFSQGGVIAYQLALTSQHSFAGVMALSTYLANKSDLPAAEDCNNGATPFLIHHGSQDPVVSPSLAIDAKNALNERGFEVEYATYDMPHSVCPEQVSDISAWLHARLS
ncbi:alpha/beta hydrolase [Marinomonas pollencensis]|uniref:Phospholipase/carboxylesterase n=1 Tax=Marinomonas pollencensis TaxID=491954 RepID=A0A3E0DJ21_9GAMM|nr:dienelactone hydrolase family protein [Marinomonas pollencensis]REG81441.1 phospholipase/carboxylesterase [Marinomonas pollencensis]